jgi:hypothetical protein
VRVGSGEGQGPVGVGPGVGVGRGGVGRGVGDGVGRGAGATAVTGPVETFGDGERLELGALMYALDVAASERSAAQESRPHKAVCACVCARGRAAAGGL